MGVYIDHHLILNTDEDFGVRFVQDNPCNGFVAKIDNYQRSYSGAM
jgi:hypothetical protein